MIGENIDDSINDRRTYGDEPSGNPVCVCCGQPLADAKAVASETDDGPWCQFCTDREREQDAIPEFIPADAEVTERIPPQPMRALMGIPTPEELDAELLQHAGAGR